ncbi:acyl-CoA/acyl-ACP dehydrogenase [Frankia sp. CNm7]|uniref:Acyl-CoA/acyl-ACP dehydrogenase n=1 Tax=Frankia nepalensis TaxID=1836974 RepID=A0A937RCS7_9ACTN|nr:acyl-CoA dehydrogenase family protein [Frankia nepalensis]MBL7496504.1 acyl-CoA/acyl-ACP dehydrogenase [Frankia nepalensis]MBL7511353.1 acyl-CoA/acyl-ACP dehydrogenase [Frankia nepalensis]MBL7521143.1 acyl-CoA/acyl-ACP dehydrogenase [Frankia nepalensis]MBL7627477.1 acyl-CoA/acyl-ACP dehydrogenase [Frankia nepalensis]
MDFAYTEEQRDLADLARRIFTERVTHDRLTVLEADICDVWASPDAEEEHSRASPGQAGAGDVVRFDRELWGELARANLLGVGVPEEFGGLGYGVFEECLVLEEAGRALAPVPLWASATVAAGALAAHGTEAQRRSWLPALVGGEKVVTVALAEPGGRDAASPATRAARLPGGGWRLDGVKTAVPFATVADAILVPAGTEAGTAVFLVDPAAPGVSVSPQLTTAREVTGLLRLDGVRLGDEDVLGGPAGAVGTGVATALRDRATLGVCALQLGVTERALRAAAEYTSTRQQFGRPIGSFQAVGHRLADCYIDVEAIRLTLWQAAWRLGEGLEATEAVATAKFWAADGGHRVASAVVHVHGGMGIAEEYFVHRYFLHAKQLEFTLGGASEQARRLGDALAATPAPEHVP